MRLFSKISGWAKCIGKKLIGGSKRLIKHIPTLLGMGTKIVGNLPGGKYTDALKQGLSTASSAYYKAKGIVDKVKQSIPPEVKNKIKQAVDGYFLINMTSIGNWFKKVWRGIKRFAKKVWMGIVRAVSKAGTWLGTAAGAATGALLGG